MHGVRDWDWQDQAVYSEDEERKARVSKGVQKQGRT